MADYGVDLGVRRIALVCVEKEVYDELLMVHADVQWGGISWKLHNAAWWIRNRTTSDDTLWIEAPIVGGSGNPRTAIDISMMAAAVITGHPGPAHLIAPSRWKAQVLGYGSADKPDVYDWLLATCPQVAAACGTSEDLRDAACLALGGTLLAPAV